MPQPHRYVHGGFTGTDARFSIYFPSAGQYQGRFFQHITPVPGSEHLAQTAVGQEDRIGFAFGAGGYFLETNGGGPSGTPESETIDPTVAGYRANAASAEYSRVVAGQVYGEHRPYGYAYGGSGGAYRTIGAAENTSGVWDGFVPYVPGSPVAAPNVFAVRMHAQRVLRAKLGQIVDAFEPGGSGDPNPGLTGEERDALAEVTRMGFPPRSWFGYKTMGSHAFGTIYPHLVAVDPGYFEEFWTTPGYLGADPEASVHRDRVSFTSSVTDLVTLAEPLSSASRGGVDEAFKEHPDGTGAVVAVRLSNAHETGAQGAELILRSGKAAGARLSLAEVHGDLAVLDPAASHDGAASIRPGDLVQVDNSNFLAAQTYHRHQVPGREYRVWDQFRDGQGAPIPPQRPFLVGPMYTAAAAGHALSGKFTGKMILVSCLLDREAFPWQADWYRTKVTEHLGAAADDQIRLWYVDNALHADSEEQEHPTHTVSYLGVLHEALRSVADWAENGVPPLPSTAYTITDGQVEVAAAATARGGVQPVVTLTVNGLSAAEIAPGEHARFTLTAEVPTGAGLLVGVQWDLDGDGVFEISEDIEPATRLTIDRSCAYDTLGTRFAAVRVSSHHDGNPSTAFGRIDNLSRARIVVAGG
jgi:hypothetical protein